MPAGRPPKPVEQKRRLGNPGKRPLPSKLAAVPALNSRWENRSVTNAIEAVLEQGSTWLATTDEPVIAALRDASEDYERLRNNNGSGKDIREARLEVTRLLSTLGFDPTSRSKLGLAEVKAASTLDKLRAKRQT